VRGGTGRAIRAEGGQAAAEVLAVGAIVVITVTLVVVRTWAVVDAKFRIESAAREAARAYVEASGPGEADADARRAAWSAMGVGGPTDVPGDPAGFYERRGGFGRCERIDIRLRWEVPGLRAWVVTLGAVTVTGSHTEVVDPYRTGRDGPARCATPAGGDP
jgi:hypothetical protein